MPANVTTLAVLVALITSGLWGTGDFFGGLATKQQSVVRVMLWVHGIGLVAVAAVAPFLADEMNSRDLAIGAIAGLVGVVGLLLLYWSLAQGPMAVVAPLSALTSALLPVVWGWFTANDPISTTTVAGLVLGLAAVVMISWHQESAGESSADSSPDTTLSSARPEVAGAAILAGVCFGSLILLYDATSEASAPWPVVSGRVASTAAVLVYLVVRRVSLSPGGTLGLAATSGLCDTFANVTLLYATSIAVGSAELATVAVVASFYPAATVLWAKAKLDEPLHGIRLLGIGAALGAIALMTLG